LLKECGLKCFGGIGWPKIFVTDNAQAEINAIKNTWPESDHLLCIFHVCQAVWRWLWDSKNNIPQNKRPILMKNFQNILYADTVKLAEYNFNSTINSSEYPKWTKYITDQWDGRQKWCLAWRNESNRGHHTNNYSEITVSIFKDTVLSRVKAYNVIALLDFTCTVLEEHYCRRLMTFANCRNPKNREARIFLDTLIKKANYVKKNQIIHSAQNNYIVPSEKNPLSTYDVNLEAGCCSCSIGKYGKFCKHQCAVYIHYDEMSNNFPPVTPQDRHEIAMLASGDKSLKIDFFQPFYVENSAYLDEINIAQTVVISDDEKTIVEKNKSSEYVHELNETDKMQSSLSHEIADTNEETCNSIQNILKLIKFNDKKYGSSSSGIQTLEARLKKITSEGQWETFLHTAGNVSVPLRKRSGAKISVQPTSIARRSPNITRGSKRLPSGRPAKCESGIKKRKRNLGSNVNANLPNAKSYGRGH